MPKNVHGARTMPNLLVTQEFRRRWWADAWRGAGWAKGRPFTQMSIGIGSSSGGGGQNGVRSAFFVIVLVVDHVHHPAKVSDLGAFQNWTLSNFLMASI